MRESPTEYLALLRGCLERTEATWQETEDPERRAQEVVAALRLLWPQAALCACNLKLPGFRLCVFGEPDAERGRWLPILDEFLARHDGEELPPRFLAAVPPGMSLPGRSLAIQPIQDGDGPWGVLIIAIDDDAPPESTALLWELLRNYGSWLGAHITFEAARHKLSSLRHLFAEQTEMANLAALAGPVTHEFNNFLNTLLLQLMVLASQVPEGQRAEIKSVTQQGKAVAALVRHWQQHRAQRRPETRRLDVNELVREVVEQLPPIPETVRLRLGLAADLPTVETNPLDLRLAVRLLILNAAAALAEEPGVVEIVTHRDGNAVVLSVEDTGPSLAPLLLPRMFELSAENRERVSPLELATCEALVQRRLRGEIRAEDRPGGGVVVRVRLRAT
jgi:signal transduction histidine kinase